MKPKGTTPWRWLLRAIMLLIALQLTYLAVANIVLNTGLVQARINQSPDRFTLTWAFAWSAYPGHLRLETPRLEAHTTQRHLSLALAEADARIALWPLVNRTLRVTHFTARGIEQARLDDYQIAGRGQLRLAGLRWQTGELGIERLELTLDSGNLTHDGQTLVADIQLDARLHLAPFTLNEHPGASATPFVSGRLSLTGRSDAYEVFNRYLAGIDWLSIEGRGQLDADIEIDAGHLLAGSELSLDSPALGVTLDEAQLIGAGERYHLTSAGTIRAVATQEDTARLEIILDDMHMAQTDPQRPVMQGNEFRMALVTSALELGASPQLQSASLQWEGARMPDVGVLNRYLPAPLPFDFTAGEARLQGRLELGETPLAGEFDVAGDDIEVRLGEESVVGQLDLHVAIQESDITSGRLDLSGTQLKLQAASSADDPRPLVTSLAFPVASFHAPLGWEALDDTEPAPWNAELAISGQIANLGWLDPFLAGLFDGQGLTLEGGGRLQAALVLDQGNLMPGSRLEAHSEQLASRFLDFRASGTGRLKVDLLDDELRPQAHLELNVSDVNLQRLSDDRRLFQAQRLTFSAQGDAPGSDRPLQTPRLEAEWQGAQLPDVAVLNAYLPQQAPLRLIAGTASSEGQLTYDEGLVSGRLRLAGNAISGQAFEAPLEGQLTLDLVIDEADLDRQRLDISGSRLELQASSDNADEALRTVLVAHRARLSGGFDWPETADTPQRAPSGTLHLEGALTHLGFLNTFLPDEHGLQISGDGRLTTELTLSEGQLAPGSQLRVLSSRLGARFLHYEALGDGTMKIEIAGDERSPTASMKLDLPSFGLRSRNGEGELIAGRLLSLHSQARHFDLEQGLQELDTRIDMPYVVAPNLALFNAYLPENAGIELLGGRAELSTQLHLAGMSASGSLSLRAPDASLGIETQTLRGALSLDAQLADGDLENMTFDLSGSSLKLDDVRLESDGGHRLHGWWAHLDIPHGQMTWQQPLEVDAQLDLAMRDSGLLVNLFVDAARQRQWLRNRLTVGDVRGTAQVVLDETSVALRDVEIYADRLEMLANLTLSEQQLMGRMFARYGPFRLGIGLEQGQRHWQWRQPRQWYEQRDQNTTQQAVQREWVESVAVE